MKDESASSSRGFIVRRGSGSVCKGDPCVSLPVREAQNGLFLLPVAGPFDKQVGWNSDKMYIHQRFSSDSQVNKQFLYHFFPTQILRKWHNFAFYFCAQSSVCIISSFYNLDRDFSTHFFYQLSQNSVSNQIKYAFSVNSCRAISRLTLHPLASILKNNKLWEPVWYAYTVIRIDRKAKRGYAHTRVYSSHRQFHACGLMARSYRATWLAGPNPGDSGKKSAWKTVRRRGGNLMAEFARERRSGAQRERKLLYFLWERA